MIFQSETAFIVVCIVMYYFISRYKKQSCKASEALPGPRTYPIIGSIFYWKCLFQINANEYLYGMNMLISNYPSPFGYWLGNKLIVYVSDPDQIKTVLQSTKCLNKSSLYSFFEPWLQTGLFTAPASIWQPHRKMIVSNFNTNMLKELFDSFVKNHAIFMDELAIIKEDEVNFLDAITKHNLDVLYDTMLGVNLESQFNQNYQLVRAMNKIKKIIQLRIQYLFLYPKFLFNLTSLKRKHQQCLEFIHSVVNKVIDEKENMTYQLDTTKFEYEKLQKKVLLDVLIEKSHANKVFTRDDIFAEINTMFIAGSDTISITLYFVIYMLANFPKVQEKVYEELLGIYGTADIRNAPIKFDDLQLLNYLERVIKETMRLFPVTAFLGREVTEDLKLGKCTLPKGTSLGIATFNIHRNEKYWPNALTFDPDRFLPENSVSRHPYCYLPFSKGPRNCIGSKYAMISMKIFLIMLVRTYVLKIDKSSIIDDIKLKVEVLLCPTQPLKIKVTKRNSNGK